ncbi:MAG: LiaF transmembrane domain-containing protein [Acutalibacteraceae bacterium]|jgi:hypothetical protein
MNEKKWSWRSRNSVFWGVVLVGAAVLLILQGAGVSIGYEISLWRILLGALCLAWLIDRLAERQFAEILFPLAFGFLLFEGPIAHALGRPGDDLISNWTVLLAALLGTVGLKAILPKRQKDGVISASQLGSATLYLDAADLQNAEINDHMGAVQAYVTNRDAYPGNGVIRVHDNMGTVKLYLPREWNVVVHSHDNLGGVHVPEQPDGVFSHAVTVEVFDNMGSVSVLCD